jgi:hypothetical protein
MPIDRLTAEDLLMLSASEIWTTPTAEVPPP